MSNMNLTNYEGEYSDKKLASKVGRVFKKAGQKVIYIVMVLYYLVKSDVLSAKDKTLIYGALGYFILPIDLIPDTIPALGYTDDLALLIAAFFAVVNHITPEIKAQAADRCRKWWPDFDVEAVEAEIYTEKAE